MTREELMALTHAELKAYADEAGIEYPSRANKTELAELIYEKTNHQEGAQEVAQALKESDNDLLNEDDFAIVEGQMVRIITKKDDEVIEAETPLDDLLNSFKPMVYENIELLNENDTLKKENERLKHEKAELEAIAYREVIGHPSQEPIEQEVTKIEWDGSDAMTVRARVTPNRGITTRIRAGLTLHLQWQEFTLDYATFTALVADDYVQVEILESSDE